MRIAVFHNLPHGGALRVTREYVTRLGDEIAGIYSLTESSHVDHAAPAYTYPVQRRKLLRSPFGRLNGLVNLLDLRDIDRMCVRVAAEIDAGGYDVVLVNNCSITQTPAVLKYLRTPTVYYCQEPFRVMHEALSKGGPFLPLNDPLRMLYSRAAIANEWKGMASATRVACNSFYSKETMLRTYGINAHVVYPGIDVQLFRPVPAEKTNTVLSVGRLSPAKGHTFVIDSLALIDASTRPELGIICGPADPGARAEIERRAHEKSVKVMFHEDISDEVLVNLYCSAKATLVAGVLEPFGLVPLESMACGTPIVAVAEGGFRETVTDGETGFLTNRNPKEFAKATESLLIDTAIAEKMGKAGAAVVPQRWTWDHCMARLRQLLEEAVDSK